MTAARTLKYLLASAASLGSLTAFTLVVFAGWAGVPAIVVGFGLPPAIHALLLGLQFMLAGYRPAERVHRLNHPAAFSRPIDRVLGPAPRWQVIKAWLREIPIALHCFGYLMPFTEGRPLPSGNDPTKMPVVLVHGYLCNRAAFNRLSRWLAARGHAIHAPTFNPWQGPIDTFTDQLARAIETLRQQTGADKVALVGHSMGGLVIRAYLVRHGHQAVHSVVTLGSPHQGTWMGRLSRGSIVRDLTLGSDWLQSLQRSEPDKPSIPFTVIMSRQDNIVSPQDIQTIPGARLQLIEGYGHLEYLYDARIWRLIDAALNASDPAVSGPPRSHASGHDDPFPRPDPGPHRDWPASANR